MSVRILQGDCRDVLPTLAAGSVQSVVTSPPYWGLRDYGVAGQIGLEATPGDWIGEMVEVFRAVRRVLRDDGTLWLNCGDSYNSNPGAGEATLADAHRGSDAPWSYGRRPQTRLHLARCKPKDLLGMPWRLAFALQADGWFLRADIVWAKPNPMPESVTDRPTKAHEYIFLLSKSARYFYDADAVREPTQPDSRDARWGTTRVTSRHDHAHDLTQGMQQEERRGFVHMSNPAGRNLRSVWTIPSAPFSDWTKTSRRVRVEPDAADGGTTRIPSPDCPVHGDHPGPDASARDGGHAGDPGNGSGHSGIDLGPVPPGETGPIDQSHGDCLPPESPGLPFPDNAAPAIARSRQSRRTGRAPATNPPCMPSAETPDDTPRTAARPVASDSADRSAESNTAAVDSAGHPSAGTADHSGDSRACRCEYYRTITENTSHFATFPPALASRCIQAGTSEKGCCGACGAPWARQTERTPMVLERSARTHALGRTRTSGTMVVPPTSSTLGWQPSCACDAPVVPCTVLDPFGGSGTVGMVAEQLGRHSILIELSPAYVRMAEARTAQLGLFAQEVATG